MTIINWINSDNEEKLTKAGETHLENVIDTLSAYLMIDDSIENIYPHIESDDIKKELLVSMHDNRLDRTDSIEELDNSEEIREHLYTLFNEYGLSFGYVEATEDDKQDYFR